MAPKPVKRPLMQRLEVPPEKRKDAAKLLWTVRARDRRYFSYLERKRDSLTYGLATHSFGKIDLLKSYRMAGGIRNYESDPNLKAKGISIMKLVERKAKGRGGKVRVLDVGCGLGVFLEQLRKAFPGVQATGLTLAKPLPLGELSELKEKILEEHSKKHQEVKEWEQMPADVREKVGKMEMETTEFRERMEKSKLDIRTGLAETYNWGNKKFDLIFSSFGLFYAVNPVQALKNTLSHLAKGGEAFVRFKGEQAFFAQPEIKSWLEKNRITTEFLGNFVLVPVYRFVKRH